MSWNARIVSAGYDGYKIELATVHTKLTYISIGFNYPVSPPKKGTALIGPICTTLYQSAGFCSALGGDIYRKL